MFTRRMAVGLRMGRRSQVCGESTNAAYRMRTSLAAGRTEESVGAKWIERVLGDALRGTEGRRRCAVCRRGWKGRDLIE